MVDYRYKSKVLEIDFSDGSKYEYFDVPANVYTKLLHSDAPGRFIRRNICSAYVYRMLSRPASE
ncbi:MAG TPA: KTSC domain-containing protein, partial [Cytophagales bacterium]|nr:KTSC domain-containing protein [Cytophagales bacterium]